MIGGSSVEEQILNFLNKDGFRSVRTFKSFAESLGSTTKNLTKSLKKLRKEDKIYYLRLNNESFILGRYRKKRLVLGYR